MDSFSSHFVTKSQRHCLYCDETSFYGAKTNFFKYKPTLFMTVILLFFVAQWYLSLFFQTFFLHRYAAHKAFTMNRFTEKVFFVLTWLFQGPNYLSPFGYGTMHRMHHAFADTETIRIHRNTMRPSGT